MNQRLILLILFVATLAISCKTTVQTKDQINQGEPDLLFQHRWMLAELNGFPVRIARTPYLSFSLGDDRRIYGFAGCNQFKGTFELGDKHSIRFTRSMMTRMACPDTIENVFLTMIDSSDAWSVSENSLLLKNGRTVIGRFIPATGETRLPGNNPLLYKGRWELINIGATPVSFDSLFPSGKPWVSFRMTDSTYSGFSGCNSFNGKLMIDKNAVQFRNLTATERGCPGSGEQFFFSSLSRVTRYEATTDTTLTLFDPAGTLMKFKRQ